ncbi:hypothetical protein EV702DRAFT_1042655 [Suillus placidus]|uniref:Uncharacterized protein n=1 Tax=Suillus placidus TaxID=48579 RepID=A0A9P7A1W3_9AGAM|nr:hypothetical protein EV702DRAFT_1042655 [Suillus placidus]
MPPKKKARHAPPGSNDDQPTRQSSRSNRGVGGHTAQLQKAGELVMAPTRQGKANDNIEINESEENPMAPSQLTKAKKNLLLELYNYDLLIITEEKGPQSIS